jgi:uncharacterized membrane protein (UPF0127 family)
MSASDQPARSSKYVTVISQDRGVAVCERCRLADTPWSRLRGLLGRRGLETDEGLMLRPAGSIHMFFMRFPIDAVFLDRDLRILRVAKSLGPWRMAGARGAHAVLELAAGESEQRGLLPGERLELVSPDITSLGVDA